jgi:hypothetical protein
LVLAVALILRTLFFVVVHMSSRLRIRAGAASVATAPREAGDGTVVAGRR